MEWCPTPTQVFKDGKFYLSIGTPGGYGIAQTTAQMLMHVLDFGMNVQQAIEAPRFKCTIDRFVEMEVRVSPGIRDELARRRYDIVALEPWSRGVGGAQAGMIDLITGVFRGGAGPHRDGYAMDWQGFPL